MDAAERVSPLQQAAEKRLFCALRACLRQIGGVYFQQLSGTFSLRSPMAESHGLPSRALIQVFTHEGIFPLPAHSGGRLCHTILVLFHIFFSFSLGVFPQPLKAVP